MRHRFTRTFDSDMHSGARRKLLPLRELMSEQYELSSRLFAKSSEQDRVLDDAVSQLRSEATLQVSCLLRAYRLDADAVVRVPPLISAPSNALNLMPHPDLTPI